ncbi:hypothetical protein CEV32_0346 [Brucella rhizosphaerae]|uniref:Uncharacterized protein n=1 Tax=Brucella rhizosphaerae TaxID=571254 RepID=A0A256FHM0_9HYPH|nr:hypothetical protein CEV32_0346 [Brucella rhizosphaerae]
MTYPDPLLPQAEELPGFQRLWPYQRPKARGKLPLSQEYDAAARMFT